jgi:hypothetical protein
MRAEPGWPGTLKRYLYVGNYIDQDFYILQIEGTKVTDTGKLAAILAF